KNGVPAAVARAVKIARYVGDLAWRYARCSARLGERRGGEDESGGGERGGLRVHGGDPVSKRCREYTAARRPAAAGPRPRRRASAAGRAGRNTAPRTTVVWRAA